jgi:hypothetical protein
LAGAFYLDVRAGHAALHPADHSMGFETEHDALVWIREKKLRAWLAKLRDCVIAFMQNVETKTWQASVTYFQNNAH